MSSHCNFMSSKFMQTWLYFIPLNYALTVIRAFSSHLVKHEVLSFGFQNLSLQIVPTNVIYAQYFQMSLKYK